MILQAAAVEFQTTQVTRLKTDVAKGRAKPSDLQRSESLLDRMQVSCTVGTHDTSAHFAWTFVQG